MKNYSRTVGVFFGSRSPEHDISIITAQLVISGLRSIGYNVQPVYLSKDGRWYISNELGSLDFFKQPNYENQLERQSPYHLDMSQKGQMIFRQIKFFSAPKIAIDIAFPCFHGPNGEDGTFQGLCDILQVPYVGCGLTSSAITMDKVLTKDFLRIHELPTLPYVFFSQYEWNNHREALTSAVKDLGWPVFVKPARGGSSIGIARVESEEQLQQSLEVAFTYDNKVLIEKGVKNVVDLTVALTGNFFAPDRIQISEIQESRFSDGFFTYDEKYLKEGGSQLGNATKNIVIPAEIEEKTMTRIKQTAQDVYTLFECSGIARVDFLLDKTTKKFYVNEINTLPGTLYHHLWKQSGVSLAELLKELVRLADERWSARISLPTFGSNVLQKISSGKLSRKLN